MSHQACRWPETPLALLPLVHLVAQLCLTLCDPVDCSLPGFSVHGDSLGKNTGLDSHFHKLWKILQELRLPHRLTCLLRNLYTGQETTVRTGHETMDWYQIGKGVKAVYCQPTYLTYMQSTSSEMPGWMKHELESSLPGEISITSDMQMTPPLCQKVKRN